MSDVGENPYVDLSVIERIYNTVSQLEIELDDDPLSFGPKRLQKQFAEAQRIRMAIDRVDLKVSRFLMGLKRRNNLAELEYDLKKKYLLANDPETRAGRNLASMEAIAQMKLQDDYKDLFFQKEAVREFEDILKIIKSRMRTIQDAQKQLKNQQRMCERELDLGEYWGSAALPGRAKKSFQLRHDPSVSGDVADLISEVDGLYVDSEKSQATPKPKNGKIHHEPIDIGGEDTTADDDMDEDEDVDVFLKTIDVASMSTKPKVVFEEEIDIEDLLGG